jgi:hypothetical protein
MSDLLSFVFDTISVSMSPIRPEWLVPLLGGWSIGKAFSDAGKAVGGAVNSVGRGITRAITPRGSSAMADNMKAAQRQQATQDAQLQTQLQTLKDQIAAAEKAAADAEKARLAQEAEAKRQTLIREYDQSARTQQQQSFGAAKDKLSRMNQMRTDTDAKAMESMQQTANSAGSKAMGIGGATYDSLDFSKMGGFANSYDPELRRQGKRGAQMLKTDEGQISKFTLPDTTNLTFGGA